MYVYSITLVLIHNLSFGNALAMCTPSNFHDDSWSLLMQLECINDKNIWTFLFFCISCFAQRRCKFIRLEDIAKIEDSSKKLFSSFYLNQLSFLSYLTFRYIINWSSVKPWIGELDFKDSQGFQFSISPW